MPMPSFALHRGQIEHSWDYFVLVVSFQEQLLIRSCNHSVQLAISIYVHEFRWSVLIVETRLILAPLAASDLQMVEIFSSSYCIRIIVSNCEGWNTSIFLCLRPVEDVLIFSGVRQRGRHSGGQRLMV